MKRYLLDTSVLIDFSKHHEPTTKGLTALLESEEDVGICAITIAEFFTGLTPEQRSAWNQFFETLQYWPISYTAAATAGAMRRDYLGKGKTLHIADALIAATGKDRQATIVTGNTKDFPMEDIEVLSLQEKT